MKCRFWLLTGLCSLIIFACSGPQETGSNQTEEQQSEQKESDSLSAVFFPETAWKKGWPDREALVVQLLGDPDNLHPTNGVSANRAHVFSLIHATLIAPDLASRTFKPYLAESLPEVNAEKTEYTFRIRKDVRFNNGEELTANDVAFSIRAQCCALVNNHHLKGQLKLLSEIEVMDNHTVRIRYEEPYIKNLSLLADFPIIQESLFDPAKLLSTHPISSLRNMDSMQSNAPIANWAELFNHAELGTDPKRIEGLGPYKLVEWNAGSSLKLERKDNHWNNKAAERFEQAKPKEIAFKIVSDPNALMLEIKNQSIDATIGLPRDILSKLEKEEDFKQNYHLAYLPSYAISFMAMNLAPNGESRKPVFTDSLTRKAMAHLVNADMIIEQLSKGRGFRISGPVSIIKESCNRELPPYKYNLEKGKSLLNQAGWADNNADGILDREVDGERVDLSFGIAYNSRAVAWKDAAEIIKAGLAPAGVEVKLEPLDGPSFGKAIGQTHDYDAIMLSISSNFSPDDFSQLFHSSSFPGGFNFSAYSNPKVDGLLEEISVTLDMDKRKELLYQLQEILYHDLPWIYLTTGAKGIVVHKRLSHSAAFSSLPSFRIGSMEASQAPQDSQVN